MAIRCLIVDDSRPFLVAARKLLEREGVTVVGCATTSGDARRAAAALRPNVILVDIFLGGESGFELARRFVADAVDGEATIVMISTRSAAEVADLVAAGPAPAFLTKEELSAEAIQAIMDASQQ
jgi:DNA-binding NarL/FixJ family response regulator